MIDKQRTNLADVEYLDLDDVAKIINDFENPVIENIKNDDDVENTSLRLADDDDIFAQAQRIADEEERKRRSGNDTNTTDPAPTQARKEAGNYKKKHLKVDGCIRQFGYIFG